MPQPERSLVADDELRLLADVVERLERLDDATRRRIVDYLFSRYYPPYLTDDPVEKAQATATLTGTAHETPAPGIRAVE